MSSSANQKFKHLILTDAKSLAAAQAGAAQPGTAQAGTSAQQGQEGPPAASATALSTNPTVAQPLTSTSNKISRGRGNHRYGPYNRNQSNICPIFF